jgi:hypothetical protein
MPVEDFPVASSVEAARSRAEVILAAREPTLRQLLASLAGAREHFTFAGTPEQVADLIEDWFTDGAADGFNIMPPVLPAVLDAFSAEVIPLLQQRGLFRTAYTGKTLREHDGLPLPLSAFKELLSRERSYPGFLSAATFEGAIVRCALVNAKCRKSRFSCGRRIWSLCEPAPPVDLIKW